MCRFRASSEGLLVWTQNLAIRNVSMNLAWALGLPNTAAITEAT